MAAGANTLYVSDQSAGTADTAAVITNGAITGMAGPGNAIPINYSAAGDFSGGIIVTGTNVASGDSINVQSALAAGPITVHAGGGDDTVTAGNAGTLDGILSTLTVDGGGNNDTLIVDDSADADANTYDVTATSVTRTAAAPLVTVNYSGTENLTVNGGINAGPTADVFNVTPSTATAMTINGNAPVIPTSPGDQLNMNVVPLASPATFYVTGAGAGTWNFSGGYLPVTQTSIETLTTSAGVYDLVFNAGLTANTTAAGGPGHTLDAQMSADGTQLQLRRDGTELFSGIMADINSLREIGTTGADSFTVTETAGGLPSFGGTTVGLPAGGHTNSAMTASLRTPANVGLSFQGNGGGDSGQFTFVNSHDVAFFSDNSAAANSGVVNVNGALTTSFDGFAPMTYVGAGGSFLADASANPTVSQLTVTNSGGANDGVSQVTGDGTFETATFSGFASATVRSGPGADTVDLVSVDGAAPAAPGVALTSITLDGDNITNTDNSGDSIIIRSLPATVSATMLGGQGDDQFYLGSNGAAFGATTKNILGPVFVSPAGMDDPGPADQDQLIVINDSDTVGDTVTVTSTTIDGITGHSASPDITYAQIGTLAHGPGNIGIYEGSGNDTFNIQSTVVNTTYQIYTDPVPPSPNPGAGDDTVNISSTAPTTNGNGTLTGDLNGILGAIEIQTEGNATANGDAINVSDFGSGTGRTFDLSRTAGVTTLATSGGVANISYDIATWSSPTDQLEHFNLTGSNVGDNTYDIHATTATQTNVIQDGDATASGGSNDGTFNIAADFLSAANLFQGFDGNDQFFLNIASSIGQSAFTPITSVQIEGNAGPNGAVNDSQNRDRTVINDNNNAFSRDLNWHYLDISGYRRRSQQSQQRAVRV